jgi:hypothetical protein
MVTVTPSSQKLAQPLQYATLTRALVLSLSIFLFLFLK